MGKNKVKIFLDNICSEFSESYDVKEDILGITLSISLDVEDLGDLAGILEGYGVELTSITSPDDNTSKYQAIFSKTDNPISGIL